MITNQLVLQLILGGMLYFGRSLEAWILIWFPSLLKIFTKLKGELGFHAHNNKGHALVNTITAVLKA